MKVSFSVILCVDRGTDLFCEQHLSDALAHKVEPRSQGTSVDEAIFCALTCIILCFEVFDVQGQRFVPSV